MNFSIAKINFNTKPVSFRNNTQSRSTNSNFERTPDKDTFELSIGYVNDIHGQVNNMMRILSGLKGDIKLSAGDNDIGDEKNTQIHQATAEFMNKANITATALGNHELDGRQADVTNFIDNTNTKVLAVNFNKCDNWENFEDNLKEYGRDNLDERLTKSMIVEVKGEKIGLVGASPTDLFSRITHPEYHKDCYVSDIDETVERLQHEIDNLKEEGVNKIVMVSHLGYQKDREIAQKLDGLDVIIGGHTHELIEGIKEGENLVYSKSGEPVIITEAGKDGKYFGQLNLLFDKDGVITKAQNNVAQTHLFSKNLVTQYLFDRVMGKPQDVGYIKEAPLPPHSLLDENPHANFVCDAMKFETNADIALWNNSGIRNYFHEGSIDTREIKEIAPFMDRVCIADVSEKTIVDTFKHAIESSYNSHGNKPGLISVSGLEYTVNLNNGKLVEMNFIDKDGNKTPIDIDNPREDKIYRVTADEYMMCTGTDYLKLAEKEDVLEILPYDKDVVTCNYIKYLNQPIVINQTGRVKFVD